MTINLESMPVIDNHCHPFILQRDNLYTSLTLSLIPPKDEDLRNTLLYKMLRKEIVNLFNLDSNMTDDEFIKIRNQLYHDDPKNYVEKLFRNTGIESFLVDYGFPVIGERLTKEELDWFHNITFNNDIKVRRIHRIEETYHRLFKEKVDFDELENTYLEELRYEVEHKNTIAFKTVLAYHTGLDIKKVSRDEAYKNYREFIENTDNTEAEKKVRDYLVVLAFKLCMEYDIPIQMHTGAGDAPLIDVKLASPLLLHNIISDPFFQPLKIILVHTAYPFVEEAGYLANQYHNIYLDLSSMIPFSSIGAYRKLQQIFEMAPFTKVMYGSDGFAAPEVSWLGIKIIKKELPKFLNKLIDQNIIDTEYAYKVAGMILSENARNLYERNWEK